MKKTYAAPTVLSAGGVVRETLSGKPSGSEVNGQQSLTAGTVGFYL